MGELSIYNALICFKGDNLDDSIEVSLCETHDTPESIDEDNIFFYGLSKDNAIKSMNNKTYYENEWLILEVY